MNYFDQLLANQDRHKQQAQVIAQKGQTALNTIRAEIERRDRGTREAIEEALQHLEDSQSAAERQADRDWSKHGQKFGSADDEESEIGKPVRRSIRYDASTRSFRSATDEEEETEPYGHPQRWHDQDMSEPAETAKPISAAAKHSREDDDEEPIIGPSYSRDWGGSTRRIGNYEDDEDD
jgi:hypothetical protein